jgi:transposase
MARGNSAPEATLRAPLPAAPLGTGHGRREESRVRWVSFERASDAPAETIAIYYDSYRNLVARGILRSRDPDPFPGAFVPDPC